MALSIASLNSGSNGNCYYVGTTKEAVLVDAGLSCREIENRMKGLGLELSMVKAILISHEHTDHVRGLAVLSNKYQLPVYISEATRKEARIRLSRERVFHLEDQADFRIGDIGIMPFVKNHDAVDPFSFVLSHQHIHVGVFTDIGKACDKLVHYFRQCHAAFLEANYDEGMLENGNYPLVLKRRIRGGKGHLSNTQALELFLRYRPAFMSHLFLSHLSQHNNHPDKVLELFEAHKNKTEIIIASRYEASLVYSIRSEAQKPLRPLSKRADPTQLSLGFGGS